jgi:hypothetical protein
MCSMARGKKKSAGLGTGKTMAQSPLARRPGGPLGDKPRQRDESLTIQQCQCSFLLVLEV